LRVFDRFTELRQKRPNMRETRTERCDDYECDFGRGDVLLELHPLVRRDENVEVSVCCSTKEFPVFQG